jgi:hypothetical protein
MSFKGVELLLYMDNNIVYCDHSHNILSISNNVLAEDAYLDKMNSFTLNKDNYAGPKNDIIYNFLDENPSLDLYQYRCSYCSSLGKPSIVTFIVNLSTEQPFIRLRKKTDGWVRDDIVSPFRSNDIENINSCQGYVIAFV